MIEKVFQKQVIMRRVIAALLVLMAFSTYLYGWRVLAINAMILSLGILTEYLFERARGKKVSEAVVVTSLLFGLSLPPLVPFWVAAVGIIFAVALGKEVFGGFGRNVFNPAITGRLFIYISFPTLMQRSWVEPRIPGFLSGAFGPEGVTGATPLDILRSGGAEALDFWQMFFGFRLGSAGETAIWLILAAAIYLMVTKTAQWRLILSTIGSAAVLNTIFYFTNLTPLVPHMAMMSGSILFVSVFMATDPVSAPNKPSSQWLYGLIIGGTTVLIRTFSGFPEGTSFGVLLGNTFASLIDEIMPKAKPKKKPKAQDSTAVKGKE
ncbi:MAG: RnfABCDGE type electron transport complex subunit D [Spirochaetales bacterium]|nr:MAG: RnfABCDGE type electron transport complex subunit D [Spirochaetales bacterium]